LLAEQLCLSHDVCSTLVAVGLLPATPSNVTVMVSADDDLADVTTVVAGRRCSSLCLVVLVVDSDEAAG